MTATGVARVVNLASVDGVTVDRKVIGTAAVRSRSTGHRTVDLTPGCALESDPAAFGTLADRMAGACAEAVDEFEIAAVLESDGVTDAIARKRYGSPDVFDLAQRLCRYAPRRPRPTLPVPGPWRATPHLHLLRGTLYGLPALVYLAVSDQVNDISGATVLIASVLLSWATSQALAYIGHVRKGWGDPEGAAEVLRGGLLVTMLPTVAVTAAVGYAVGVPVAVVLVAAAQSVYLLAATVALVTGQEWWLLAALAPGVGATMTGVVLGGGAVRSLPVIGCAAASVLAAVAVAGYGTRGAAPRLPARGELLDAAPHALFGICVGGLLLFVPAARTFVIPPVDGGEAGAASGLTTLLPLSLSMGGAEWLLYRYRAATHRAMQHAFSVVAFTRRATVALLRTTAGYLTVLISTSVIAAGITAGAVGRDVQLLPIAGYAALGGALFVALLLISFGIRGPVITACASTLCLDGALLAIGIDPERIQLCTSAALCVALLLYAVHPLTRVTRHQ